MSPAQVWPEAVGFNEDIAAQEAAAHDASDQVRTIAGPGTGKSFTIEERRGSLTCSDGLTEDAELVDD